MSNTIVYTVVRQTGREMTVTHLHSTQARASNRQNTVRPRNSQLNCQCNSFDRKKWVFTVLEGSL